MGDNQEISPRAEVCHMQDESHEPILILDEAADDARTKQWAAELIAIWEADGHTSDDDVDDPLAFLFDETSDDPWPGA
jgi:hypothetical protein